MPGIINRKSIPIDPYSIDPCLFSDFERRDGKGTIFRRIFARMFVLFGGP